MLAITAVGLQRDPRYNSIYIRSRMGDVLHWACVFERKNRERGKVEVRGFKYP